MKKLLLSLLAILPLSAATLRWDPNTETNIAGYFVYTSVGTNPPVQSALLTNTSLAITTNLVPVGASASFSATALNTAGIESDKSVSVSYFSPAFPTAPLITSNVWSRRFSQNWTYAIAWGASPTNQQVTNYSVVFERLDANPSVLTTNMLAATSLNGTLPFGLYRWNVSAHGPLGQSPVSGYGFSFPVPFPPQNLRFE